MAAPLESEIEIFVKGFDDSAAKKLANGLQTKQTSLLSFIESLGIHITSSDTATRARATRLIADVLHGLPTDFLSQSEVGLLSTFLCEKLADHHSIHAHALYGLLAVAKCTHVSEEVVKTVCQTIFREVHTQSLPQGDRRIVFELILVFLNKRLQDVQKLEGDFVYGFMQAMDAEKDPRNLILAFTCALVIIQNFSLDVFVEEFFEVVSCYFPIDFTPAETNSVAVILVNAKKDPRNLILAFTCALLIIENFSLGIFVEEFFEVVSCYFPIDFTPSANDPSGIKKEDLILALRRCMSASPQFAKYCLPLLMEKLTSDLKSAKIDALETLSECTKTYSTESLNEFQSQFFNCIKKEVFLSGDENVEKAAFDALQSLVKALSAGINQGDRRKSLDGFVEEILQECRNHLLQPELMLMLSSGRLLQSTAQGSDLVCSQIVKSAVPALIETYNKQTQATPKYNVILVLDGFMECTRKFNYTQKNQNPILFTYKEHILTIYTQAIDSEEALLFTQAVKGIHTLFKLPQDSLVETEKTELACKLVKIVVDADIQTDVRHVVIETLQTVISTYPEIGQKHVLPVIFSTVNKGSMDVDGSRLISPVEGFTVLSTITCDTRTLEWVIEQMLPLITVKESLEYYRACTKCLNVICEKCASYPDSMSSLCKGVQSIHRLVQQNGRLSDWREILTDELVLKHLSSYLRNVAINWTAEIRTEIQSKFIQTFLGSDKDNVFSPLKNKDDAEFVCLLTPVVCSDSPKVGIPNQDELITSLLEIHSPALRETVNQSICKCLAGIINKLQAGEYLDSILLKLRTKFENELTSGSSTHVNHVRLLSWITKALVIRGHPVGSEFCAMLFNLLSSESGREAARGFNVILCDFDDVLNKQMRANIKMMYKQRFFQENFNKVTSGYCDASQETKQNYLMCLSYMIKDLTKQVLLPELSKIYPLLIQSLLCDDLDLQLTTLRTLGDLIESSPDIVDKQLDSLLPQLLKLARHQKYMKVRISSLDCICKLTKLPAHIIMPHLKSVTRALTSVLDDKKRLVRAKAAETRMEWFLLETENK